MTDLSQKKGPRKGCVPGGRRTLTFPGAIGRPLRRRGRGANPQRRDKWHGVSEASRLPPCKRPFASRPAGISLRTSPVQAHPRGRTGFGPQGCSRTSTPLPCGALMRCGGYGISFFASRPVSRVRARFAPPAGKSVEIGLCARRHSCFPGAAALR